MITEQFFQELWEDYTSITPQAQRIHDLFVQSGERVLNDHVAFRTFNRSPIDLDHIKAALQQINYHPFDTYFFKEKKLRAYAFSNNQNESPLIFVSELLTEQLSERAQQIIRRIVDQIPLNAADQLSLFTSGQLWEPLSFDEYTTLLHESEYAGWLSVIGIRPNHFTVAVHQLKQTTGIEDVLKKVETAGYVINEVGGRVKGSPETFLEQGSTMADYVKIAFRDGISKLVPSCFYEFAKRHPSSNGKLFRGFVTQNADKIFESTHAN